MCMQWKQSLQISLYQPWFYKYVGFKKNMFVCVFLYVTQFILGMLILGGSQTLSFFKLYHARTFALYINFIPRMA